MQRSCSEQQSTWLLLPSPCHRLRLSHVRLNAPLMCMGRPVILYGNADRRTATPSVLPCVALLIYFCPFFKLLCHCQCLLGLPCSAAYPDQHEALRQSCSANSTELEKLGCLSCPSHRLISFARSARTAADQQQSEQRQSLCWLSARGHCSYC